MIPGLNLLGIAAGVIQQQTVQFKQWLSRDRTSAGEWVDTYADAVPIRGSWQPVDMRRIAQLGLDMKMEYRQLWTDALIQDVGKNPSRGADQIIADGKVWVPTNTTQDWSSVDGWRAYVLVAIGPA
jgi:hypothetical protein